MSTTNPNPPDANLDAQPGVLHSLSAAEQVATLDARGLATKLGPQTRAMQKVGYDPATRTIQMSISSEEPVQRYYGIEILSHAKGAIRTGRLEQGMALLFNHDMDAHLGITTDWELKDAVLRTSNKLGSNPLALEKEKDVADDILRYVSLAYNVYEWEITENAKTGARTYLAVDWEPYENSLVTVPADPTVGVGRALAKNAVEVKVRSFRKLDDAGEEVDDEEDDDGQTDAERAASLEASRTTTPEAKRTAMETTTAPVAAAVVVDHVAEKAARTLALTNLSTANPKYFGSERLQQAIALDIDTRKIQDQIFDAIVAEAERSAVPTIAEEVFGSMSEREAGNYSIRNVYAAAVNARTPGTFKDKGAEAGFEREVGESLRKLAGERGIEGLGAGIPVPSATSRALFVSQQKRTVASGGNAGGATNFTTVEADPIELLRFRCAVLALGARMRPGLQGTIQMPRQTAASTSSWVPEGSSVTSSDPTYDYITMGPKPLMIQSSYYRNFLAQSRLAIDSELSNDRNAVLAQTLDTVAIAGAGTGVIPLGILNRTGLALVLSGNTRAANGTLTAGAGGVPMTYVDWNDMEANISTANADIGTMGILTTPRVRAAGRSTPKTPGTNTDYIFPTSKPDAKGVQEGPLGYNTLCTSNPALTGFTANSVSGLHAAIMGVWSQLMIGDWGLSEIIADPYTGAANQKIIITENAFYDVQVRHLESFCACLSALPS